MDDRSQRLFQEIPSPKSCDSQEEFIACLERIKDAIKDNLVEEEIVDDPTEVVLDRLVVLLDWTLVTAVVFMIMGMSYLRSLAFKAFGDATTHELFLKLTQITNNTAMNDVFLALLAQTPSPESPRYTLSRRLVQMSILSSYSFTFLAILAKLFMGRNGLNLNVPSRHKSRGQSQQVIPRRLILILKTLPNAFLLTQLMLGTAFVVTHYLAL